MKRIFLVVALLFSGVACEKAPSHPVTTTTSSTSSSSTTTMAPTTVTTPPVTTVTTIRPSTTSSSRSTTSLNYVGIYPFSNSVQTDAASSAWEDPVFTARKFLVDYVGFTRLIMGKFHQGDNRSGEVTATTRVGGFVTTVFVRQIGSSNNWTVIGASTDNIKLSSPSPLKIISSPVHINGQSIAFEGTVLFEVRQDGQYNKDGELGFAAITGHGTEMGPISGDVAFKKPTVKSGAVIAYTTSAEDGHISEVTAVKVRF